MDLIFFPPVAVVCYKIEYFGIAATGSSNTEEYIYQGVSDGYSANSRMTDDELRSSILIEYIYINDLVHLEGFFVRCDFFVWCLLSCFK